MKNVCLICLSFLFVISSFAQSKRSSSSISVTNEENKYVLDAKFSKPIAMETKDAIVQKISEVLEVQAVQKGKHSFVWEEKDAKKTIYSFKLLEKRCNIKINRSELSPLRYKELCDLGKSVAKMLGKQKGKGMCETNTTTSTSHQSSSTYSNSKGSGLNIMFSGRHKGDPTSVAINESDGILSLNATYPNALYETIVKKVKAVIGDDSKDNYETQVWKKSSEGAESYNIKVKEKSCTIAIDKNNTPKDTYEALRKLCLDISHLIMNSK